MTPDDASAGHERLYCGAEKRQGPGTCTQVAGWGTDHLGEGHCKLHLGSTRNHVSGAKARLVEREARRFLSQEELVPIADPVSDLLALTAESRAMYVHLRDLVAETETQRWSAPIGKDGRAALDVLVAAMERAMERTGKLLEVVVRLNLEERLVAISEAQAELIRRVIFGTLADPELALSVEVQAKAPAVVTRHLRAVKAG